MPHLKAMNFKWLLSFISEFLLHIKHWQFTLYRPIN